MENCSLRVKIPQKNSSTVNINIDGGNTTLDIWQLSMNKHLTGKVPWDGKPPWSRLVSTTDLFYGMETTLFNFCCLSGTFHTFEVVCRGASLCYVDGAWWEGARESFISPLLNITYWHPYTRIKLHYALCFSFSNIHYLFEILYPLSQLHFSNIHYLSKIVYSFTIFDILLTRSSILFLNIWLLCVIYLHVHHFSLIWL